jgi:hypothetical protein
MESIEVLVSLDRIGTRITWTVGGEEQLERLRMAIRYGEFGRAHIVEEEPALLPLWRAA